MLWCRSCGLELSFDQLHLRLEDHRKFEPEKFRWNILMQCASCVVGRPIKPDAGRNYERALYHLITYGIVRIEYDARYKPSWLSFMPIHMVTGGHAETARGIAGRAVQKVKGVWVASHKQEEGYFLSHLKTVASPCMPASCSIDLAEVHVKHEARQKAEEAKTQPLDIVRTNV